MSSIHASFCALAFSIGLSACGDKEDEVERKSPFDKYEVRAESGRLPDAKVKAVQSGSPRAAKESFAGIKFSKCRVFRVTCVVDGDTFWLDGVKIRVADIDTPEVSRPQCPHEKEMADRATKRFVELLNAGAFELVRLGTEDEDHYGRKLRIVVRDGRSLGDQMVTEGLARTWNGRREPWC